MADSKFYRTLAPAVLGGLPMTSSQGKPSLRQAVRLLFPECRGAFAAQAPRELLERLVRSEIDWRTALAEFRRLQGDMPPEGVAGENPPPDGVAFHPIDGVSEDLGKFVEAARALNPVVAAELDSLVALASVRKTHDASTSLDVTEGFVTIAGVQVPLFLDPDDPRLPWVPDVDENYRFDIWRAARTCGAMTFELFAGDLVALIMENERILLVGPPGCGKTSFATQVCAAAKRPMTRFNGNQDVTVDDFVGTYEARDGQTVWVDGALTRALREGHLLLLDEVDHMPAECSSVLHSVLEPGGKLVITAHGGEVVRPHANFAVLATANTAGFGDETGLHPNAQVQDGAFLSRFTSVLHVAWLKPEHEVELLVNTTNVDMATAELMVKVANDTRDAVEKSEMLYPVTLRQTMAWADKAPTKGLQAAFALCILNKVPTQDAPALAEICQRHFGDQLGGTINE